MSGHDQMQQWAADAESLAEFVELADSRDVSLETQASYLLERVWERDVPLGRAIALIQEERARVAEYQSVSLSASSRAPRYMDLTDLELVSGYEFEHVLAEILRRIEGDATVTDASGDQGVDVVWFRGNQTVGIQAKAYDKDNPVGNSAVQEIYTGSTVTESEYSIDTPAVVTTSRYTDGAREAAENSDVLLYGRDDLRRWLAEAELDAATMGELLENI